MKTINKIIIAAVIICGLFCGVTTAENTVPAGVDETEDGVFYTHSHLSQWFDRWQNFRAVIYDYSVHVNEILRSGKSSEEKLKAETEVFGWTDKLERYVNAIRLDEETGEPYLKYEYSLLERVGFLFGNKPDLYYDYYEGQVAYQNYLDNFMANYQPTVIL